MQADAPVEELQEEEELPGSLRYGLELLGSERLMLPP
jgi:hypothetical protein